MQLFVCNSPELFSFDDVRHKNNKSRLAHAFAIAKQKLGIENLLDPEGKAPYPISALRLGKEIPFARIHTDSVCNF